MAAVKVMIIIVSTVEMPITSHLDPMCTIPPLVHPITVPMAANFAVMISPEPAWFFVVMVSTIKVPISMYPAPVTLEVLVLDSQAVQVHAPPPVAPPSPLDSTMMAVVIMIASVQPPVASDIVPSSPIPSAQ
jgi:hypothetical protein